MESSGSPAVSKLGYRRASLERPIRRISATEQDARRFREIRWKRLGKFAYSVNAVEVPVCRPSGGAENCVSQTRDTSPHSCAEKSSPSPYLFPNSFSPSPYRPTTRNRVARVKKEAFANAPGAICHGTRHCSTGLSIPQEGERNSAIPFFLNLAPYLQTFLFLFCLVYTTG